jgi:hypothetical protein
MDKGIYVNIPSDVSCKGIYRKTTTRSDKMYQNGDEAMSRWIKGVTVGMQPYRKSVLAIQDGRSDLYYLESKPGQNYVVTTNDWKPVTAAVFDVPLYEVPAAALSAGAKLKDTNSKCPKYTADGEMCVIACTDDKGITGTADYFNDDLREWFEGPCKAPAVVQPHGSQSGPQADTRTCTLAASDMPVGVAVPEACKSASVGSRCVVDCPWGYTNATPEPYCSAGTFSPKKPCVADVARQGTAIRVSSTKVGADGLYLYTYSDTDGVSWKLGSTHTIRPVSKTQLELRSATLVLKLAVAANGTITVQNSTGVPINGASAKYGKVASPFAITNGSLGVCSSMLWGESCDSFSCDTGYGKHGSFVTSAETSGQVTSVGTCVKQSDNGKCTAIEPGTGATFEAPRAGGPSCTKGGEMDNNGTCAFTCDPGYYFASAAGAASKAPELTCKNKVATPSGTCTRYPSGIFVKSTGPEGGHYIFDATTKRRWYKDGDPESYVIVAKEAGPLGPLGPLGLELKSNSTATAVVLYAITISAAAAGPLAPLGPSGPALTVTAATGAAAATSTTAEFVCGAWDSPSCTGFTKSTADLLKRTGVSTGTRTTATLGGAVVLNAAASAASVILFKQSDGSWVGTSTDKRYVHVLGAKVTIVSVTEAVEAVEAVVYTATASGPKAYVLTPVVTTTATAAPAATTIVPIVTISFDPDDPINANTTAAPVIPAEGLSTAAIVGIVLGAVAVAFIIFGLAWLAKRKRHANAYWEHGA